MYKKLLLNCVDETKPAKMTIDFSYWIIWIWCIIFCHFLVWEPYVLDYDTSIITYFGHSVLKTLIRCRFSPAATTGQRYIYTGDSLGRLVSKFQALHLFVIQNYRLINKFLFFFLFSVYDLLSGKVLCQLKGHKECIRDVSWHPFHPHIVTSAVSKRSTVKIFIRVK